jgi:uncharacterized membrane protein
VKYSFCKWYLQALGATFGIIACIFGYLNGYMFVYTNIANNFDALGFDGIISSYLLLPMCIVIFLVASMRYCIEAKKTDKDPFDNYLSLNNTLLIITIILGFLGTKLYFIIPTMLILSEIIVNKEAVKETDEEYDKRVNAKIIDV